jgi:hypothetical protein
MFIPSKHDKAFYSHFPHRIAFLAAADHCIDLITTSGEKHVIDGTLDAAHQWFRERHLPFIRVHRSYIVNFYVVEKIEEAKIIFIEEFRKKLQPDVLKKIEAINMTASGWEDYEKCCADFRSKTRPDVPDLVILPANGFSSSSTLSWHGMPHEWIYGSLTVHYHFIRPNSNSGTL